MAASPAGKKNSFFGYRVNLEIHPQIVQVDTKPLAKMWEGRKWRKKRRGKKEGKKRKEQEERKRQVEEQRRFEHKVTFHAIQNAAMYLTDSLESLG